MTPRELKYAYVNKESILLNEYRLNRLNTLILLNTQLKKPITQPEKLYQLKGDTNAPIHTPLSKEEWIKYEKIEPKLIEAINNNKQKKSNTNHK